MGDVRDVAEETGEIEGKEMEPLRLLVHSDTNEVQSSKDSLSPHSTCVLNALSYEDLYILLHNLIKF